MNTHILYKKGRESRTIQGGQMADEAVEYCHSSRRGRAAPRGSSEGLLALRFWPTGRRLGRGGALPLVRTDPARRPDPGRCRTSHRTQPQDHRPMDRRRPGRGLVATWERQAPARGYRGVIRLVAERHTLERRCEWCGSAIPPAGVQRASRATRRWCSGRGKGAHANEMRRQGAARGASAHQGGRNPYRTGPRRGGVVLWAIGRAERAAMAIRYGKG